MSTTKVKTVNSSNPQTNSVTQNYLITEKNIPMRFWENAQPAEPKPEAAREYETVGYVIEGKAELHLAGRVVKLKPGDSWVIPKNTSHTYKIIKEFTAIEAVSPTAV